MTGGEKPASIARSTISTPMAPKMTAVGVRLDRGSFRPPRKISRLARNAKGMTASEMMTARTRTSAPRYLAVLKMTTKATIRMATRTFAGDPPLKRRIASHDMVNEAKTKLLPRMPMPRLAGTGPNTPNTRLPMPPRHMATAHSCKAISWGFRRQKMTAVIAATNSTATLVKKSVWTSICMHQANTEPPEGPARLTLGSSRSSGRARYPRTASCCRCC